MIVAFIPARGGSQRIPRKNLAEVGGVSLVARAIDAARNAGCDRIVVSTDDAEVAALAARSDVEIHARPDSLAGPHAQIEEAIAHWIAAEPAGLCAYDVIALLQPTTPFRRAETIRECVATAQRPSVHLPCATAREGCHGRLFAGRRDDDWDVPAIIVEWERDVSQRPRSQDTAGLFEEDGNVYAFTVGYFNRTGSRMAKETAVVACDRWESFEIDTPEDLEVARLLAPMMDGRQG